MSVFQGVAPWHTIFTLSCVIPLWDSTTAHSPSCKELNPSSQEDARFSGRCTLAYHFHFILRHPSLGLSNSSLTLPVKSSSFLSGRCPFFRALHLGIPFSFHPASSFFGTQQQLTHSPVKSCNLPLRKMPVFQGVVPWHTIFTASCVIPLWDSATAHSSSGKELISSSLEESCFSGLILPGLSLVWYSPILLIKSICAFLISVVCFYSVRPSLSEIFYLIFDLFL